MNLSSFCNPVVFLGLVHDSLVSFGETVSFYAMDFVIFGVHFFYELSYPPWWAVGFSLS